MDHQMLTEIVSLKARIVKNTDEHKIAMFQNTKTVKSIVKMHKETVKFMDNHWLSCQVMTGMNKVYDNLLIINR